MVSRFAIAKLVALASFVLARDVAAHGGAYIGEGPGASTGENGIPAPTGGPAGPGGPGPATGGSFGKGPATGDPALLLASWEDWWHFNRDPYLDLKRAVRERTPTTRDDDLAGELRGRAGDPGIVSATVASRRIGPALAQLLEKERSGEIRTGALVALARLGEMPIVAADPASKKGVATRDGASAAAALASADRIAAFLGDANQETAETAALALGILQSEDALPRLRSLLCGDKSGRDLVGGREVSVRTRAFAAYGLGLVAARAKNNRTRQLVARALTDVLQDKGRGVIGDGGGGPGGGAGAGSSASRLASLDVQVAAVIGLSLDRLAFEPVESTSAAWISRQTLLHFVEDLFGDVKRHAFVRAHAATAIARLAQDAPEPLRVEAIELLLKTLRTKSTTENEVVQSCVQALGLLGDSDGDKLDREIRNALLIQLGDGDVQARAFAMIAIAEIGARPGPGEGNDEGLAGCRNALAGELAHGRRWMRPWAALAIGVLERRILDGRASSSGTPLNPRPAPSDGMRELLRSYLADAKARDAIGSSAIALGLCRDTKAAPLLLRKLHDASEDNGQGYVALALGMTGAQGSAEALREIAADAKHRLTLLEDASIALALCGDNLGAEQLVGLLPQALGQAQLVSLANAIGFVGDGRAVEPLLHIVEQAGETASARAFAAAAVGRIADKDMLPWFAPVSCDLNYVAHPASLLGGDGTGLLEIL